MELTIERPVAGGRMLARLDGRIVLVSGALPGERVRARVERVERGVAFAAVEAVIEPSPDRRPPPFEPACGGGAYAHARPEAQPGLKRDVLIDALRHGAGLAWHAPIVVHAAGERGYRLRARLHVRGGRAGFFREGTHHLCDAAPSAQLDPAALDAIHRQLAAIDAAALDAVEISENLDGSERALHLHPRADRDPRAFAGASLVAGITGLSAAVDGGAPIALAGVPTVRDPIARLVAAAAEGPVLRRHAAAFFQGNRFLVGALATAVVDAVPDGPVWDLYAGVGLFGAAICAVGRDRVTAVEGDPVSGADLRANAAAFDGRLTVEACAVEACLAETTLPADATVVLDPPRTGLSTDVSQAIAASAVPRIVYVSCDVATLARDLRIFRGAGFDVVSLAAFDLFPNTAHVETLAVLSR